MAGATSKQDIPYREIKRSQLTFDRDENNLLKKLGDGGFGVVYLATYTELGNMQVAAKRIKGSQYGIKEKDVKQLRKEANQMFQARHSDILAVYGIVCDNTTDDDKLYCIVTEYMEMGSLEDLMEKAIIPWPIKGRMLRDVARGLQFLCNFILPNGKRLIHGDVKSKNILVDSFFKAKIGDFGTSVLQTITSSSTKRHFEGTVTHMAPEQLDIPIDESGNYDPSPTEKSDVWSYGITMFELAADVSCAESTTKGFRTPFPVNMKEQHIRHLVNRSMKHSIFNPNQKKKIPDSCPDYYIMLMENCCRVKPEDRPDFRGILETLNSILDAQPKENFYAALNELCNKFSKKMPTEEEMSMDSGKGPSLNINQNSEVDQLRSEVQSLKLQLEHQKSLQSLEGVDEVDKNASSLQFRLNQFSQGSTPVQNVGNAASNSDTNDSNVLQSINYQLTQIRKDIADIKGQKAETGIMLSDVRKKVYDIKEQGKSISGQVVRLQGKFVTDPTQAESSVIIQNFMYLKAHLDPDAVKDYLHQENILSVDDMELIRTSRLTSEKVEIILEKVDRNGEKGLRVFYDALKNYQLDTSHIINRLQNTEKVSKVRQHAETLCSHMHPDEVVVKLFSKGVITMDDKQKIKAEPTTSGKVMIIIEAVTRGGYEALQLLITALDDTNQKRLADMLRGK